MTTTLIHTLLISALSLSESAQAPNRTMEPRFDSTHPPRFEDFPVNENWNPPPVALKLTTPSERMFKTKMTEASKGPPNFAGHYRMTFWGCGSECSAAALVDLRTGDVIQPPLARLNAAGWYRWIMCPASFEGTDDEFHVDSRLMIVRCGMNFSERLQKNIPDTYYFVLEQRRFRQLLVISGKH